MRRVGIAGRWWGMKANEREKVREKRAEERTELAVEGGGGLFRAGASDSHRRGERGTAERRTSVEGKDVAGGGQEGMESLYIAWWGGYVRRGA